MTRLLPQWWAIRQQRVAADQQRALGQSGTEPLPGELKICLTQAQEDINRAAQFLQGDKITREEYAARCQKI